MYRAKAGDVFAIPIGKKEFLSGRVLLDVETQCATPGRLRTDSPLVFFASAMMIEVHATPVAKPAVADDRVLIPSIFVTASALTSGRWKIVGQRPVDPSAVDFPPALTMVGPTPHLAWGELQLPIDLSVAEMERVDVSPTLEMSRVDQIALFLLGREQEIDRKRVRNPDILRLDRSDLRFHARREELFARAGLPAQPRYYGEALKRGFDLRRFYEPDPKVPFLVCPYCWARRTPEDICWACGEDTSRDAAIETSQQELDTIERKACPTCKTRIPDDAIICSNCRTRQPDDDGDEP
jgi:hypothetical protein